MESVLASSLDRFELIVIDDGTSGTCSAILHARAVEDPRIRVVRADPAQGADRSRSRALRLTAAPYVKFLEAGDVLYRHGLSILVEALDTYPEAAVAGSGWGPAPERPFPHQIEPVQGYRREFLRGAFLDGFQLLGALFRREALEAVGGPGPARTAAERRALALRILARQPIVRAAPTVAWSPGDRSGRKRTRAESLPTRTQVFRGDLGALTSPGCPLPDPERRAAIDRRLRQEGRVATRVSLRRRDPRAASSHLGECWAAAQDLGLPLRARLPLLAPVRFPSPRRGRGAR
jgi:hypothetical protein